MLRSVDPKEKAISSVVIILYSVLLSVEIIMYMYILDTEYDSFGPRERPELNSS